MKAVIYRSYGWIGLYTGSVMASFVVLSVCSLEYSGEIDAPVRWELISFSFWTGG